MDHDEFVKSRARFGEWEVVSYCSEPWHDSLTNGAEIVKREKLRPDHEPAVFVRIQHGTCHCGVCGHRWTYECDEAGCTCCRGLCS